MVHSLVHLGCTHRAPRQTSCELFPMSHALTLLGTLFQLGKVGSDACKQQITVTIIAKNGVKIIRNFQPPLKMTVPREFGSCFC